MSPLPRAVTPSKEIPLIDVEKSPYVDENTRKVLTEADALLTDFKSTLALYTSDEQLETGVCPVPCTLCCMSDQFLVPDLIVIFPAILVDNAEEVAKLMQTTAILKKNTWQRIFRQAIQHGNSPTVLKLAVCECLRLRLGHICIYVLACVSLCICCGCDYISWLA
ncbi:MAG TPA: hypothetical protein V6C97_08160 [Oculatellaceae cyanobacterium]